MSAPASFSDIRRALGGISDSVLSERLTELAHAGLVLREVEAGPPVAVRYRLTPAGHELADVVLPVATHAERAGTFITWEGRLRPYAAVLKVPTVLTDSRALHQIANVMGAPLDLHDVTDARRELRALGRWNGAREPGPDVPAESRVHAGGAPSADPSAKPTPPDPEKREAALAKALAEKLGVDEATVTKAFDEIRAARQADRAAEVKTKLDAAVKDGTLTQAEADAVTKAIEKGVIGGR